MATLLEVVEVFATGVAGGGLGVRAVVRGPMLRRFCGGLVGKAPFVPTLEGNAPLLLPAPLLEPFTERSCKHMNVLGFEV